MSKKLFFNWSVTIETDGDGIKRMEGIFNDKYEITEQEMLEIFRNRHTAGTDLQPSDVPSQDQDTLRRKPNQKEK